MTEKAKRNTAPLTVGKAVDMVLAITTAQRAAEQQALAAVHNRFQARREAIYARVPRHLMPAVDGALNAMLGAELHDPVVDGDDGAPDDENDEESDAGVEYGTMPPQAEQGLPKGATDFTPGPAAQAALRGRR